MDEEPRPFADRWVRIMCDFAADGVWDKDGLSRCADELPLHFTILDMIRGWQEWYEFSDRADSGYPPFDLEAHSAFGLFIARMVKRALPDWTVVYYDEHKAASLGREGPRRQWEYEILIEADGSFRP